MKTIIPVFRSKKLSLAALLLFAAMFCKTNVNAQPPDCVSGNVAYAVFNDSIGSTFSSTLDSLEIRPVNLLTGAVGNLMGNRRYWVRKQISGTYYYGSSALAVDFASSKFFVMTQMSSAGPKDIVAIDPVLGTTTVIGTTPVSLDGYHFVKMTSHSTNGWIYAIGVHRDSTTAASLVNPVIRFPVCATLNCATANIQILGYLPSTGVMYKWQLFNGDIAFDLSGNLFFATAALDFIGGTSRYTDARLFRINSGNLPTSAGAGTIPMTLVADYNVLDSTVINGMAFNLAGTMFFTTRKYLGPQNSPLPPFQSQLYQSTSPAAATLMPGFVRPTAGTSVSDLATCYYPNAILAAHRMNLTGRHVTGTNYLEWEAFVNPDIRYFQVQHSYDGVNFENTGHEQTIIDGSLTRKYTFSETGISAPMIYYRVVEATSTGARYYSNIVSLLGAKIALVKKVNPNPFRNQLKIELEVRTGMLVNTRIFDQNGQVLIRKQHKANPGVNNITLSGLENIKAGMYFIEISAGDEIIREKIVKQ